MNDGVREALLKIAEGPEPSKAKLQGICDLLRDSVPGYDWVGYYLVDPNSRNELVLGPFAGEPTEHVRIGFGSGICGQAASRLQVFVVDDVDKESNYLSCSPKVKSEVVIPVIHGNELVGELDLDSHKTGAFSREDSVFLGWVAELTAPLVAEVSALE